MPSMTNKADNSKNQALDTQLSLVEQKRLSELDDIIVRGLQTFFEVGSALAEIRDSRLHRQTHQTFEDYCQN